MFKLILVSCKNPQNFEFVDNKNDNFYGQSEFFLHRRNSLIVRPELLMSPQGGIFMKLILKVRS